MALLLIAASWLAICSGFDPDVLAMVSTMSLADKAGQMTQLNINTFLDYSATPIAINRTALRQQLRESRIGSILNSPYAGNGLLNGDYGWNASQWRQAIRTIQEEAADAGAPPVLFGLDSVHGALTQSQCVDRCPRRCELREGGGAFATADQHGVVVRPQQGRAVRRTRSSQLRRRPGSGS